MSFYYSAQGETREIADVVYASWVANGNPKAAHWTLRPPPPVYDPQTHTCRWVAPQWIVAPIVIPVPSTVTTYQWRAALRAAGRLAAFRIYVNGLTDSDEKDYWLTSPTISRTGAHIASMRTTLGVTNNQLDTIFIAAGNVQT